MTAPGNEPVDRPVDLSRTPAEARRRHDSNRRAWNEGAARYTEQVEQTIDFIRRGQSNLHPVERAVLGDLHRFETAIHLQCAAGRDTLSLWVEGVQRVVGVDISEVMIDNARHTSEAVGAPAEWFRCDVLDTPHQLDATADLVYTGRGALNWIHDLDAWAAVVARVLRPGGIISVFETHPAAWLFDEQAADLRVMEGVSYFGVAWESQGWPSTYIGQLATPDAEQAVKYDRLWNLADVFTSLRRAGLEVVHVGEHAETYWDSFPLLEERYRGIIPQTFTMVARRPLS